MSHPIVTLTTDFGLKDPYVAELKAVILSICSNVTMVDITHNVEKFNIRMGAYVIAFASSYFTKDTIHIVVVDPGVGTQRLPLLIQTKQFFYIGPDNGILALVAKRQGMDHIYEITNRKFMLSKISRTFHGRDIFAPAAAHLANGVPPREFGPEIHEIKTLEIAKVVKKEDLLIGEVLYIDNFGNIITNLTEKELELIKKNVVNIEVNNVRLKLKLRKAYEEVKPHEPLAIIGSHNFLEISINQSNAANKFKAKIGDKVKLYPF